MADATRAHDRFDAAVTVAGDVGWLLLALGASIGGLVLLPVTLPLAWVAERRARPRR